MNFVSCPCTEVKDCGTGNTSVRNRYRSLGKTIILNEAILPSVERPEAFSWLSIREVVFGDLCSLGHIAGVGLVIV